jgi:hypothetical protein
MRGEDTLCGGADKVGHPTSNHLKSPAPPPSAPGHRPPAPGDPATASLGGLRVLAVHPVLHPVLHPVRPSRLSRSTPRAQIRPDSTHSHTFPNKLKIFSNPHPVSTYLAAARPVRRLCARKRVFSPKGRDAMYFESPPDLPAPGSNFRGPGGRQPHDGDSLTCTEYPLD